MITIDCRDLTTDEKLALDEHIADKMGRARRFSGFARVRLTGIIGTVLLFVATTVLEVIAPFVSVTPGLQLFSLLVSVVPFAFLLYSVWVISRAAGSPNIFRFYVIYVVLGILGFLILVAASQFAESSLSVASFAGLALVLGLLGLEVASAVFLFASFARIADTLGYRWFLWSGRLAVVGAAGMIVPFVGAFIGLAAVGLQLVSFYSLGEKPQRAPSEIQSPSLATPGGI